MPTGLLAAGFLPTYSSWSFFWQQCSHSSGALLLAKPGEGQEVVNESLDILDRLTK